MKKAFTLNVVLTLCYVLLMPALLLSQVYVANGSAVSQGSDCFLLTPALTTQAGSVWSQNKVDLSFDFEVQATLNFGTLNGNGADGIAFVFQPLCTGLGSSGGGLGYEGITPSLAVEYDTWTNSNVGDPFDDHISVQQNGSVVHQPPFALTGLALMGNIEDGLDHTTTIQWDATLKTLFIYFDGMIELTYNGDIVADIFGGNPQVFWGFTAATGAAVNNQRVCINSVTATESIPYVVTDASCPNASDGAIDFTAGPGFTFLWNTGATTEDLAGVPAGTYTLSVIDAGGCASDYTIEVGFVPDQTPPEARCRNISAPLDAAGQVSISAADVDDGSVDNCQLASISIDIQDFGCAAAGAQQVTLTVTDASGNSSNCSAIVTVSDPLSPVVNCPGVATTCGADLSPETTGFATAIDNCGVMGLDYSDDVTSLSCADEQQVARTWSATDNAGNISNCIQLINVVKDQEAPECLNCPGDLALGCGDPIPDLPQLEVSDNCDPNPEIALISTTTQTNNGSCTDFEYIISRSVIVTDRCGNTRSYPQTIMVKDETGPDITCPPAANISCGGDFSPSATGEPYVLDACNSSISVIYSDVVTGSDCNWDCTIVRTWTASDACDNTTTCEQVITSSTIDLIETALDMDINGDGQADPLILGGWQHSLSLGPDVAHCLGQWIPASGATPTSLVRARVTATTDCGIGPNPLDPEGHFVNPLLGQGLLLSLKLRIDPAFGNTLLSEVGCNIHPVLYQYMTSFYTITDLMKLTNLALGNIIGPPHLPHLLELLNCVNGTYQLCDPGQNAVLPLAGGAQRPEAVPVVEALEVYPNPAGTTAFVNLSPWQGRVLSLQLIDGRGTLLQTLPVGDTPLVELDLQGVPAGVYLVRVNGADKELKLTKLVKR